MSTLNIIHNLKTIQTLIEMQPTSEMTKRCYERAQIQANEMPKKKQNTRSKKETNTTPKQQKLQLSRCAESTQPKPRPSREGESGLSAGPNNLNLSQPIEITGGAIGTQVKQHTQNPYTKNKFTRWGMTLFTYNKKEMIEGNILNMPIRRAVFQEEKGEETEKLHMQIYFETTKPTLYKELLILKPNDGSHLYKENFKGALEKYCMKEKTRVDGPWIIGQTEEKISMEQVLERIRDGENIYELAKQNVQVALNINKLQTYKAGITKPKEVEGVRGIWLWGEPGAGKSYIRKLIKEELNETPYIRCLNTHFWNNYNDERIIIVEDFNTIMPKAEERQYRPKWLTEFKIIADRYECMVEIKGGYTNLQHDWYIVTSNQNIEDLLENLETRDAKALLERFQILYMNKNNREEIQRKILDIIKTSPTISRINSKTFRTIPSQ